MSNFIDEMNQINAMPHGNHEDGEWALAMSALLGKMADMFGEVEHLDPRRAALHARLNDVRHDLHVYYDDGGWLTRDELAEKVAKIVADYNRLKKQPADRSTTKTRSASSTPKPAAPKKVATPPEPGRPARTSSHVTPATPTSPTTPPAPAPQPDTTALDSGDIAAQVLAGLKPVLAKDDDGNVVEAASKASVDTIRNNLDEVRRDVDAVKNRFGYERDRDGNVTFTNINGDSSPGPNWVLGGIIGLLFAIVVAWPVLFLFGVKGGIGAVAALMIGALVAYFAANLTAGRQIRRRDS